MDELNIVLINAFLKYFYTLSLIGHVKLESIYKIITLAAVLDILTRYSEFITDNDLKTVIKIVYCLLDGCLISFPEFINDDDLFKEYKLKEVLRETENNILRLTEDSLFRAKN